MVKKQTGRHRQIHAKSIFSFLLSKVVIIGCLIIIQLAFLILSVLFLADNVAWLYGFLMLLSLAIVVWLVGKEENPSYKLAWVILIMALPVFGGLFYLVFGNKSMPRKLASKITDADNTERKMYLVDRENQDKLSRQLPRMAPLACFLRTTTGAPLWHNTQAEYYSIGEEMWPRMVQELDKAERFIFMEYFILAEGKMWTPIFEILKRKAAQGLDVRFMYDDIGSIQTLPNHYDYVLRAAGIKCVVFNPFRPHLNSVMNYRDHRKITVIDGNVGFCGGINIADEYINDYEKHGHWKDTGVLLRGDAVWNLTAMFLSLWNFSERTDTEFQQFRPTLSVPGDGYVQPFGDSPLDRINVCEDVYMHIINRATRYVYITTPYLILDNEMVTALQTAARSGVDVRIITPHVPDKWFVHQASQSFYGTLLRAGVRIYEYTPGFVHAKMYVSDDCVAVVGTANMDYRSFYLHFECGVCFYNNSIVREVKEDIFRTMDLSSEIPQDYQNRVKFWKRIVRAFLRLFSPML